MAVTTEPAQQEHPGQDEQPAAVPVSFRVTTYWQRKRNEAGPTQMASQRLLLSQALEWVLGELPDEAVTIEHNRVTGIASLRIDWNKVPDQIRYGKRPS